jgi:hypothetical protein
MDSIKIKTLLWLVIALFGAFYLGITAATAQFETVALVLGGITLIICFALDRKIWLLLPFLGSLQLTLMIPGAPSTLLVGQILFIGFTVMMLLVRTPLCNVRTRLHDVLFPVQHSSPRQ